MKKILLASLCMLMAVLAVPVEAAFPVKGHDTFESKAKFRIRMAPAFGGGFVDTPILYDPDTTALRSDPHTEGNEPASPGAIVGGTSGLPDDDGTRTVHDSEMTFPDGWDESQATRREIHTELYDLLATGGGFTLKAGALHIDPKSVGEVASQDATGSSDFPADSFFDIFFEVDVPDIGRGAFTLYNKSTDPLIIKNEGITALPPWQTGYVHDFGDNNFAIRLYIKGPNTFFGWLTKGIHGIGGVTDNWLNEEFENLEEGILPIIHVIPTVSEWGLIIMAGLLLTVGAVAIRRRLITVPA